MLNANSNSASTYQQQAYDFIREHIFILDYKPGEYITDTQVAARLNISRTPVREAFRRLEKEGLLINEARRGWKVYALSLDDIHEIFDVKVAIEGMIARKAAESNNEELRSELSSALENMEIAAEKSDVNAWILNDQQLHKLIFDLAENERARRVIMNLNDQWFRVRVGFVAIQGRMKRSGEEHQDIIRAILDRNGAEAEQFMRQHLNRVREELAQLLINLVLPFVEEGI
jgi:DNA-binding GntR family transcriptional regulator